MRRGRREVARPRLLDGECRAGPPIPWYLITSYLYYVHDVSIISDGTFDAMCHEMLGRFDSLEHPHKHLIDKNVLEAGSGFHLKEEDFPSIVKSAAIRLAQEAGFPIQS